jgi:hypothetical protein
MHHSQVKNLQEFEGKKIMSYPPSIFYFKLAHRYLKKGSEEGNKTEIGRKEKDEKKIIGFQL